MRAPRITFVADGIRAYRVTGTVPTNQNHVGSPERVLAKLGTFFRARRDDITRLWIAAVDRSPEITSSNDLTYRQVLDHLPHICDELADLLQGAPNDAEPSPIVPDAGTDSGITRSVAITVVCETRPLSPV